MWCSHLAPDRAKKKHHNSLNLCLKLLLCLLLSVILMVKEWDWRQKWWKWAFSERSSLRWSPLGLDVLGMSHWEEGPVGHTPTRCYRHAIHPRHAAETASLDEPGRTSVFPWVSWRRWAGRSSGLRCSILHLN